MKKPQPMVILVESQKMMGLFMEKTDKIDIFSK